MDESEKYDKRFDGSKIYNKHYSEVFYYRVWRYVANSLLSSDKILELGCGPGQLANLLYDRGIRNYIGIDFSKVAIRMARARVPLFTFILADLNKIDYSKYTGFKFVSTETFEHLENDIAVIRKFPKNDIIFSVPSYRSKYHRRRYLDEEFIRSYYKDVLNITNVTRSKLGRVKSIFIVEAKII